MWPGQQEIFERAYKKARAKVDQENQFTWEVEINQGPEDKKRDTQSKNYIPSEIMSPEDGHANSSLQAWRVIQYKNGVESMPDEDKEKYQYLVGFYDRQHKAYTESVNNYRALTATAGMLGISLIPHDDESREEKNRAAEIRKMVNEASDKTKRLGQALEDWDMVMTKALRSDHEDMEMLARKDFLKMTKEDRLSGRYQPIDTDVEFEEDLAQYGPPSLQGKKVEEFLNLGSGKHTEIKHITMDFRENSKIDTNLLISHLNSKNGKNMTTLEKNYCEGIYEAAFTLFYDKKQTDLLHDSGIDQFDLTFINGKSVNEQFADKYKGMEEKDRERMLKCEVMAAKLNPENRIGVARLVEAPDHSLIMGPVIALKSEGTLHEPKPTLGQRILAAFGIRKIIPLQQKFEQANQKMEQTKVETEAALSSSSKLDIGILNRVSQVGSMKRANELGKAETVKGEYENYFSDAEKYLPKFETSARGIIPKSQLSRPSATLGILYGRLLNKGMSLSDVIDPSKRVSEKTIMARQTLDKIQTPEGLASVVAEANLGFQKLDINKEMSTIMGQEIHNAADMKAVLNGRERGAFLATLRKVVVMAREVDQISGYVKGNNLPRKEVEKNGKKEFETDFSGNPNRKVVRDEYLKALGPEGRKGEANLSNFVNTMNYHAQEHLDFYTSDEFLQGRCDSMDADLLNKVVQYRCASEDCLCDLAAGVGTIGKSVTKPFSETYSLEGSEHQAVSREKQVDYLLHGDQSEFAGEIKGSFGLTPELQARQDQRIEASLEAWQFEKTGKTIDKVVEKVKSTKHSEDYQESNRTTKQMNFSELMGKEAKEAPVAYRKSAFETGSVAMSKAKSSAQNAPVKSEAPSK